jgi:hypothetical protein
LFANIYDEYGKLQLCEFTGDYGLDFYLYKPIVSNIVDVSDLYTSGQIVDVLVTDGQRESYVGKYTVNASGEVDLSAYGGLGLTHAYVGKVFTTKIVTNPFDGNLGAGPVTGEVRGIANVVVDMRNAWSMSVNNRNLVTDGAFSGKKEFRVLGYSRDPQVTIEQQDPLPLQINGIVAELIV